MCPMHLRQETPWMSLPLWSPSILTPAVQVWLPARAVQSRCILDSVSYRFWLKATSKPKLPTEKRRSFWGEKVANVFAISLEENEKWRAPGSCAVWDTREVCNYESWLLSINTQSDSIAAKTSCPHPAASDSCCSHWRHASLSVTSFRRNSFKHLIQRFLHVSSQVKESQA